VSGGPLPADQLARVLHGMPELDTRWSRLVSVGDADGVPRTWHVLDNGAEAIAGTMLCVHGNPTWSYLWRRFVTAAPAGWRALAVDQLGMGYSERLERPRLLADRIDDLSRVTAELGVTGRVVIAAHDWGGPVLLGWALAHLTQVVGLVLANTGVALSEDSAPTLIRLARSPALRELVCVRTSTFVQGAAALSQPPLSREVQAALRAPYGSPELRRAVGDFVADIPLEPDHPSRPTLQSVADGLDRLCGVPALLLWGPRDPVFSDSYLRDLTERLPQADVHRYPGASHLVTEDAPQAAEDVWHWVGERVQLGHHGRPPSSAVVSGPPLDAALRGRSSDTEPAVAQLSDAGIQVTSFAELEARVGAMAAGLRSWGVEPGHRVALLVPPGTDLTAAVYACWRVGASIVVADAGLGLRRMAGALRSAYPDWLIAIPAGLAAAAAFRLPGRRILAGELPPPLRRLFKAEHTLSAHRVRFATDYGGQSHTVRADDGAEAAVLFTSGATGPPKGVVYRHYQLRAQLELVRRVCDVRPTDRLVAAFAPFALYGPALGMGAAVPNMDVTKPATLTAPALAKAAAAIEATLVFASPAALRNVAATATDLTAEQRTTLGRIRLVLSAGAPVPLPLLREVQELLPAAELHTPYGMTEALPVTDISLPEIEEAGAGNGVCVGRPLSGVSVRISPLDELGRSRGELTDDTGVTGEICVAAAHVKDRYDKLWATEAASSRNPGWHRTGDVGHLDSDGRLWVEGRLVHVVATADGPVTPVGLEQRIETLEGVSAAAIVGVGPIGTQQVVAIVVCALARSRGPLVDPELAAAVRSAAQVPLAAVLVVDALPVDIRHASKVDRTRLARWADRVLAGDRADRS
jgi:acyl-coenzyme A synthetase/AMP-(fatty) acid ligase/pimeloyl-ACP methyl ester carboxylesterase